LFFTQKKKKLVVYAIWIMWYCLQLEVNIVVLVFFWVWAEIFLYAIIE
jgi:hypothetical protein